MVRIHSDGTVNGNNTLVLAMYKASVYCKVGTGHLNVIQIYFMFRSFKKWSLQIQRPCSMLRCMRWHFTRLSMRQGGRQCTKRHYLCLRGRRKWINFGWQSWLIGRTHPIHQSCQHVERHGWPFKANVSFRRSEFNNDEQVHHDSQYVK
jgi:hypothetical protein